MATVSSVLSSSSSIRVASKWTWLIRYATQFMRIVSLLRKALMLYLEMMSRKYLIVLRNSQRLRNFRCSKKICRNATVSVLWLQYPVQACIKEIQCHSLQTNKIGLTKLTKNNIMGIKITSKVVAALKAANLILRWSLAQHFRTHYITSCSS